MNRYAFSALLGSLVGCYSPQYRDCAVTCPDGESCPDGYQCEQSLKVCRPVGASGSCPSSIDGGGSGSDSGGGRDVGTDVPPFGAYCQSLGNPSPFLFCQDFDAGTLEEQGWTKASTPSSSIVLVAAGFSAPNALEAMCPVGADSQASVLDTFQVTQQSNEVDLHFRMKVVQRSAGSARELVTLTVPGSFDIRFTSLDQGTMSVVNITGGATTPPIFPVVLDTWEEWTLRLVYRPNTLDFEGFVVRNGVQPGSSIGSVAIPPFTAAWELRLGLMGMGNNGLMQFHYDNVRVFY